MSCWVVPAVAAELWNIPLEQVLKCVRDGSVASKVEEGFTFIDVAPNSPRLEPPRQRADARPPTFTVVEPQLVPAGIDEPDMEDEPIPWREVRRQMGRVRVAPGHGR